MFFYVSWSNNKINYSYVIERKYLWMFIFLLKIIKKIVIVKRLSMVVFDFVICILNVKIVRRKSSKCWFILFCVCNKWVDVIVIR